MHRDGGHATHQLRLVTRHEVQVVIDKRNGAVARTHKHIGVACGGVEHAEHHCGALGETVLGDADHLRHRHVGVLEGQNFIAVNADLDHITSGGAEVRHVVAFLDGYTDEHTAHRAQATVHRVKLGQTEVDLPDANVIVTSSDKAVVASVEPFAADRRVRCSRSAADGRAALSIPNYDRVVILTTDGRQVGIVGREGYILNSSKMLL
mmetsp:Transcript_35210/g.60614  ORF Transcript_35210/g.60614 Transcript_35210/m.60614 type:complete len:207 (-) Transcript_35210:383-1003(-)